MTQCYWVTFTHFLLLLQLISHNRNAYQASQSRLGSKIKESVSVPSRSTAHPSEYVFDEQFVNPFLLKRVKLLCDRHITQKTVKADCKDYCYCTACLLNKRDEVLLELRWLYAHYKSKEKLLTEYHFYSQFTLMCESWLTSWAKHILIKWPSHNNICIYFTPNRSLSYLQNDGQPPTIFTHVCANSW